MLFNSLQAAGLVGATVLTFWQLPQRARIWLLLVVSYLFYATFDWRFTGILAAITAVDFVVAPKLEPSAGPQRRSWLIAIVVVNLGALIGFKHAGYFVESANDLASALGFDTSLPTLDLLVPVGISFYVFQSLGYCADVYRGRLQAERDPLVFATFVAFFAQLVAGPIERGSKLLPQLRHHIPHPRPGDISTGLWLILLGLFRKVVLADTLATVVAQAYDEERVVFGSTYSVQHSWILFLAGASAFAAQIYCDFAGYSTIARGIGKLFSIDLSINFRQPFGSPSLGEVLKRWHITLVSWFRDNVYVPMSRRWGTSRGRNAVNVAAVWILSGFWHGSSEWIFCFGIFGVMVGVETWIKGRPSTPEQRARRRAIAAKPRTAARIGTTFAFVLLAIPISAGSVTAGFEVWGTLLRLQEGIVRWDLVALTAAGWLALLATDRLEVAIERVEAWWRRSAAAAEGTGTAPPRPRSALGTWSTDATAAVVAGTMLLGLLVFSGSGSLPFYYFAF